MKRRPGSSAPYERLVAARIAALILHSVLDTLSEREAGVITMRFGLTDGEPKTFDEIGRVYGVTRERIRQIESKAMTKLRVPEQSAVLEGLRNVFEGSGGDEEVRIGYSDASPAVTVTRSYCPRHKIWHRWTLEDTRTCLECTCKIFSDAPTGRPRQYCSDSCRQAAYRRRRRAAREAVGAG